MRIANKQTAEHNATSIHFFFFGHISLILKVNVVAGGGGNWRNHDFVGSANLSISLVGTVDTAYGG